MKRGNIKVLLAVALDGQLIDTGKKTIEVRGWIPDLSPEENRLIIENLKYLMKEGDQEPDIAVAVVIDPY